MQRVQLAKNITAVVRSGHPWLYQRALHLPDRTLRPGELVVVESRSEVLAIGYADPASPIAVRILSLDASETIDRAWLLARVDRAVAARAHITGTNGLRLVHGENDFLPGLVLDRYDDVGVLRTDGAGAEVLYRPHADAVLAACDLKPPDRDVVRIDEHGAAFDVNIARGQKTGFFLDQRDNRLRVRGLAAGLEVLNLFCYTGGFTIHAALGGAVRITSVDQAKPAMGDLARNLALNDLDYGAHELVTGDAFAFLERAIEQGRAWDLVICDPPSFAPSEKAVPKALRAYRRLNQLAAATVTPGGTLVTASCSSHVTVDDMLAAVAACGRRLRVISITGAGQDHPVNPAFPEGRYLKCLYCAVE